MWNEGLKNSKSVLIVVDKVVNIFLQFEELISNR